MAKRKSRSRSRRTQPKRVRVVKRSSSGSEKIGHYAFFIGALIAIVAGLFTGVFSDIAVASILVALGAIVGLLNITLEETTEFIVASIALMLAGVVNLGIIPVVGVTLRAILGNLVVFVAPAVVIVSLRAIWVLASRR